MNYQDMSDEEINKAVAMQLGARDFCDGIFVSGDRRFDVGKNIKYKFKFDPCNSWDDAGKIAEDNLISFDQHYNGSYAKVWGYSEKGLHEVSVLRNDLKKGICIIFLMMKGGE